MLVDITAPPEENGSQLLYDIESRTADRTVSQPDCGTPPRRPAVPEYR